MFPTSGGAPATDTGDFCVIDGTARAPADLSNVTWSPDGSALAWQQPDGIHELSVPGSVHPCPSAQALTSHLAIPGASEPSWGPSDDRRFPEPSPSPPCCSSPSPSPACCALKPSLTAVRLPKRLTVRAALRHGIKVSVNVRGLGTLTARARVVGHASAYHLRRATVASERAADRPLRRVR